jgi:hypothetical protein
MCMLGGPRPTRPDPSCSLSQQQQYSEILTVGLAGRMLLGLQQQPTTVESPTRVFCKSSSQAGGGYTTMYIPGFPVFRTAKCNSGDRDCALGGRPARPGNGACRSGCPGRRWLRCRVCGQCLAGSPGRTTVSEHATRDSDGHCGNRIKRSHQHGIHPTSAWKMDGVRQTAGAGAPNSARSPCYPQSHWPGMQRWEMVQICKETFVREEQEQPLISCWSSGNNARLLFHLSSAPQQYQHTQNTPHTTPTTRQSQKELLTLTSRVVPRKRPCWVRGVPTARPRPKGRWKPCLGGRP